MIKNEKKKTVEFTSTMRKKISEKQLKDLWYKRQERVNS